MTRIDTLSYIPGLTRIENTTTDNLLAKTMDLTHTVYPHDQIYGRFCSIQEYINCPPGDVFHYLADIRSLEEWTYSLRRFQPISEDGLCQGWDCMQPATKIYCRVVVNEQAMTADYHCAWHQKEDLWMIYLMRVVSAEVVLKRPGSVVLWTNCKHPYYDSNPYPESVPYDHLIWVGDLWHMFYAGHTLEMCNLKAILEHRHERGLPPEPYSIQ